MLQIFLYHKMTEPLYSVLGRLLELGQSAPQKNASSIEANVAVCILLKHEFIALK